MTRDEVNRLAREAGFHEWYTQVEKHPEHVAIVERFAALVEAATREACALQVLEGTGEPVQTKTLEILRVERQRIADAIRARSRDGN